MRILVRLILSAFLVVGLLSCADYRAAATVNSEKITLKDFKEFCERKAKALNVESLSPEQTKEALESMIQREIIYLYAQSKGVVVFEEEVEEAMKGQPFFHKMKNRSDVEKELRVQKMKRQALYGLVLKVSKEEIEKYYKLHKEDFSEPETYRIYLVSVDRSELDHILKKLKKMPDAFDDMALRRVSKDLRMLNRNAPYASREDFPEEMWPSLETMNVGDIEGPIDMDKGTFLFKLVDRKPSFQKTLQDSYDEIEHLLTAQRVEEAFEKWYSSIRNEFAVEVKIKDFSAVLN